MSGAAGSLPAALAEIAAGLPADLASVPLSAEFRARYQLERVLACGSMGVVFLARQRDLSRLVALKFLISDAGEMRARFRREATVMAGISHPHVLRLIDHGDEEELPFHIFEYLSGGTLAAHIARRIRLPPAETVEIVLQCLSGLAECHARGVVHRDLKPENVLFGDDGQARIADLGIARDESDSAALTRAGALLGTPRYMAPEQARGQPAGEPADIYAMAAILYHMLCGQPPFAGGDPVQLIRRQIMEAPPALDSLVPGIPAPLTALVHQALAKDPLERPPSATEFASSLALALEARASNPPVKRAATTGVNAIAATATSSPVTARTRRPRGRVRVALALSMLFAFLAGAATYVVRPRPTTWSVMDSQSTSPSADEEPVQADVRAVDARLARDSVSFAELTTSPVFAEHRRLVRDLLGRVRARAGPRCGAMLSGKQAHVAMEDLWHRANDLRRTTEEQIYGAFVDGQALKSGKQKTWIKDRTAEFDELVRDIRDVAPAAYLRSANPYTRARFGQAAMIPLRPTFKLLDVRVLSRYEEEIRRWTRDHPADFVPWWVDSERLLHDHDWPGQARTLERALVAVEADWMARPPGADALAALHCWVDVMSRLIRNLQRVRDEERARALLAHVREITPQVIDRERAMRTFVENICRDLTALSTPRTTR